MMQKRFDRGVSLLELLVVFAVMTALLILLIPAFFRLLQGYRLQSTANVVATNLRFARNAALKQKVPYKLTFKDSGELNPNTYTVEYQKGLTFQPVRSMDTNIPQRIEIDPTSLNEVTFDSRGAATISGGSSVVLFSESIGTYTIKVSATGAIETIRNTS